MFHKAKRYKRKKLLVLFILILFIGFIWGKFQYNQSLYSPIEPENDKKIIFQITKNESVKTIAADLRKKNLIKSPFVFYLYVRKNHLGEKIKAGKVLLTPSMNIPQIVDHLTGKTTGELVITIKEGDKIRDIDQSLTDLGLINSENFVNFNKNYDYRNSAYFFLQTEKSLEGYLFPDTYFLSPETFNLDSFTSQLINNWQKKVKTTDLLIQSRKPPREIIIMASIIEKEVRTEEDRAIVSGILWKRLENNWPLQTDATLLYEKKDNVITKKDLESDSPYNTRKFKGLPPTPICNPGLKSIVAALHPESSPYWFYLTDENGTVIYAKTNEEQNQNRQKYL